MNDLSLHMIFSPQNCSLELLEATLTRQCRALAEDLVDRLGDACRHGRASRHILIGPRGSGKTHVLSYVRRKLAERCRDGAALTVISLSEEERTVTRLLDFLLACIRAADIPLSKAMSRIRRVPRAAAVEEARAILREHLTERPALIVIENFSVMLAGMAEDAAGELRAFFQSEPRLSLLASATTLYANSERADHPFYGFFAIEPMRDLSVEDAREFLRRLALWREDADLARMLTTRQGKARVRAIYDLTGGNHRLLAMLSLFLNARDMKDLVHPLVQMVDRELTPYYQQRLDRLSPQQNQVLRAIVDIPSEDGSLGRAVALAEIVDHTLLTSQACSRILFDLKFGSLVRATRRGRESLYELNEPLLRLVLDMKEGRQRPLPLIVNILKLWYGTEELRDLAESAPPGIREYYIEAERAVRPTSDDKRQSASSAVHGTMEGSRSLPALGSAGAGRAASGTEQEAEASRLIREGAEFWQKGRHKEALLLFDTIIERFADSQEAALQVVVAGALLGKGMVLGSLGRSEEALSVYDSVLERFAEREEEALQEAVAWALVNKGVTLRSLGRSDEALSVYDSVVERFGGREEAALQEQVARALFNKGVTLRSLGRSEEELSVYDSVVERFGEREEAALQERVAGALVNKAVALGSLGRSEEELSVYDSVVERFGGREEGALQDMVAGALFNKGVTLRSLGRSDEALSVYDSVVERFGGREEGALQDMVAGAMFNKGVVLGSLGRNEEALVAFRTVLEKTGRGDDLRQLVAATLISTFCAKENLLKEAVSLVRDDPESLAGGLVRWIQSLLPMSRKEAESLADCESVLKRVLADVPACGPAIQMLEAIRRDALGDDRALLKLPLELRRLIRPEEGEPASEPGKARRRGGRRKGKEA